MFSNRREEISSMQLTPFLLLLSPGVEGGGGGGDSLHNFASIYKLLQ